MMFSSLSFLEARLLYREAVDSQSDVRVNAVKDPRESARDAIESNDPRNANWRTLEQNGARALPALDEAAKQKLEKFTQAREANIDVVLDMRTGVDIGNRWTETWHAVREAEQGLKQTLEQSVATAINQKQYDVYNAHRKDPTQFDDALLKKWREAYRDPRLPITETIDDAMKRYDALTDILQIIEAKKLLLEKQKEEEKAKEDARKKLLTLQQSLPTNPAAPTVKPPTIPDVFVKEKPKTTPAIKPIETIESIGTDMPWKNDAVFTGLADTILERTSFDIARKQDATIARMIREQQESLLPELDALWKACIAVQKATDAIATHPLYKQLQSGEDVQSLDDTELYPLLQSMMNERRAFEKQLTRIKTMYQQNHYALYRQAFDREKYAILNADNARTIIHDWLDQQPKTGDDLFSDPVYDNKTVNDLAHSLALMEKQPRTKQNYAPIVDEYLLTREKLGVSTYALTASTLISTDAVTKSAMEQSSQIIKTIFSSIFDSVAARMQRGERNGQPSYYEETLKLIDRKLPF